MTSEDRILRGQAAQQLMGNPLLTEAFDALEADYIIDWKAATTTAAREDCHFKLSVLSEVQGKIQFFVDDGQITETREKAAQNRNKL